jgi:hypothetical protein
MIVTFNSKGVSTVFAVSRNHFQTDLANAKSIPVVRPGRALQHLCGADPGLYCCRGALEAASLFSNHSSALYLVRIRCGYLDEPSCNHREQVMGKSILEGS